MTVKTMLMCAVAAAGVVQAAEAPADAPDAASIVILEFGREEERKFASLINEAIAELEPLAQLELPVTPGSRMQSCSFSGARVENARRLITALNKIGKHLPLTVRGRDGREIEFKIENAKANNLVRTTFDGVNFDYLRSKGWLDFYNSAEDFLVHEYGDLRCSLIKLAVIALVIWGGAEIIKKHRFSLADDSSLAFSIWGVMLIGFGVIVLCALTPEFSASLRSLFGRQRHWKVEDVLRMLEEKVGGDAMPEAEAVETKEELPEAV